MKYLMFSVLLVFAVIPAYADGGWSFIDDLRKLSQDFVETITIDQKQKQELVLRNLAQWQTQREQLIQQNLPVPVQYDQVISQKQETIKNIEPENSFLSNVVDSVLVGQELGKIKSYVSEFHKLKTDDVSYYEKSARVASLESNVNQLNLVKKHCDLISVNSLLSSEDPYESIVNDYCPALQDVPKPAVMSVLGE